MPMIYLPYGNAEFDSDELVRHIAASTRNYIIQGQDHGDRKNHRKPQSLDCWLRDNCAENPDTNQAVNRVIEALVATGDFMPGHFICPESGRLCKGIQLVTRRRI